MLRLSRRSLRPSVLPCCCAEDIAPAGRQHACAQAESCAQTTNLLA
jgi:hypothetical protein